MRVTHFEFLQLHQLRKLSDEETTYPFYLSLQTQLHRNLVARCPSSQSVWIFEPLQAGTPLLQLAEVHPTSHNPNGSTQHLTRDRGFDQ